MKFEPISSTDLSEIQKLQPEGWSEIITDIEFYINSNFCFPIKTSIDEKIVGIGATLLFKDTAWLAHIIVDSEYRKQGIGFEIVNELLRFTEEKGITKILLNASALGRPVYPKVGFNKVSEYIYLIKEGKFHDYQLSENIMPYQETHYHSLLHLDKLISDEDREVLLKDHLDGAKVYIENNELKAYYLPALGEGLIIAINSEIGIELMKLKYVNEVKAVIPEQNKAAIDFLLQNGYVLSTTTGTRMIRGDRINWQAENIFGRIGGNFG